jgi:hypothetical protein
MSITVTNFGQTLIPSCGLNTSPLLVIWNILRTVTFSKHLHYHKTGLETEGEAVVYIHTTYSISMVLLVVRFKYLTVASTDKFMYTLHTGRRLQISTAEVM